MLVDGIRESVKVTAGGSLAASEVTPRATPSLESPASAASSWLQSSNPPHIFDFTQETTSRCPRLFRGPQPSCSPSEDAALAVTGAGAASCDTAHAGFVRKRDFACPHHQRVGKAADCRQAASWFWLSQLQLLAGAGVANEAPREGHPVHSALHPKMAMEGQIAGGVPSTLASARHAAAPESPPCFAHELTHLSSHHAEPAPDQGCTGTQSRCAVAVSFTNYNRASFGSQHSIRNQGDVVLPAAPIPAGHYVVVQDSRSHSPTLTGEADVLRSKRRKFCHGSTDDYLEAAPGARAQFPWPTSLGELEWMVAGSAAVRPAAAKPAQATLSFPSQPVHVVAEAAAAAGAPTRIDRSPEDPTGNGNAVTSDRALGCIAGQRCADSQPPGWFFSTPGCVTQQACSQPGRFDGRPPALEMMEPSAVGPRPDMLPYARLQQLSARPCVAVGAEAEHRCMGSPVRAAHGEAVDTNVAADVIAAEGLGASQLLRPIGASAAAVCSGLRRPESVRMPGLASLARYGSAWGTTVQGRRTAELPVEELELVPSGTRNSRALPAAAGEALQVSLGHASALRPSGDSHRPAGREALLQALIESTTQYYLERGLPID